MKQIEIAKTHGIKIPYTAFNASALVGVPFYVTCAFLIKESSGGMNVYGHDRDANGNPRPFWGHGEVTAANYREYLVERNMFKDTTGYRAQGVGPMQITFWSLQDECDALGGTWNPTWNVRYGLILLRRYYDAALGSTELRWRSAAKRYNGSDAYADAMVPELSKWKVRVGDGST